MQFQFFFDLGLLLWREKGTVIWRGHSQKYMSSIFTTLLVGIIHSHLSRARFLVETYNLQFYMQLQYVQSQSQSYVTTNRQSVSLSWCQAPILVPRPDFYYWQTVSGFLMWGAVSDERAGLSFTTAAGPRQRSHSRVRVLWDSWPYFTVSDSWLPKPGRPGPRIYIPQEQGGPVIPPGTGFPFHPMYVQSQSQSYFKTGGLPPIFSSWRQATWDTRPHFFLYFNWTLAVIVLM
jgi:hypothetical protein